MAATNHAMPGARLQTRVPNMAATVLNPLRRRQWRGLIRTHPHTLRGRDVLIRKKKTAPGKEWVRPIGDVVRGRSARPCARARYANALMRADRRESLRATVLRLITPMRALR